MRIITKIKDHAVAVFLASCLLCVSASVTAGGPLEVCEPGVPYLWPNGGQNVPFNPDQGALGILDSSAAVQAVTDAFNAWGDVPTATINYSNQGLLPVDVDITNFAPFLQAENPDGLSAIVFDDTGEIFDLLFGAGSGILGFAGPEFLDETSCSIVEGFSFLNGPAIDSLEGLLDLMVHEFGHYSNLAHTEVNGQIYGDGDATGPGSDNTTFGPAPSALDPGFDLIETMYPFLFSNIDQVARTPHADDIAALSRLYPQADFASTTGTISGTILLGNVKLTGINVIARNVADPFVDAVSAISSDFTRDYRQGNAITGTYTLTGLTPGADYLVYVNGLLAGSDRFSTPATTPPGPEEFYNGVNESGNADTDLPTEFTAVVPLAGNPVTEVDVQFNLPRPGEPLDTGDDGNVAIPLPFNFCIAGDNYQLIFINANGFITFGAADGSFLNFLENEAVFLSGPPRIAGLWDDLSPNISGSVSYQVTDRSFKVLWDAVPEFGINDGTSSNTFSIELRDNSFLCTEQHRSHRPFFNLFRPEVTIEHGDITANDGLVGVSSGIAATSQFETEVDLSSLRNHGLFGKIQLFTEAARHELFSDDDEFDLANSSLKFIGVGTGYVDRFERRNRFFQRNNSLETASRIQLPFDSKNTFREFTAISPAGDDVDFYQIGETLTAGSTLIAEVLTGQIDSVLGLYRCNNLSAPAGSTTRRLGYHRHKARCDSDQAELVATNDDSNGLLSKIIYEIPEDGVYALAVSFFGDLDFDGDDPGQGDPFDGGRYVLDVFTVDGSLLTLGDDDAVEVPLDFEFSFQGQSYDRVFVNSNGFLTFGGDAAGEFVPSVADLESGLPRISPFWTDLNPAGGGLIVASQDNGGSKTISYRNIPEFSIFGDGGSNTFAVTLSADGKIDLGFADLSASNGVTAIAEGGGSVGTAIDFSEATDLSATGTQYEVFSIDTNVFDLSGTVLQFEP